MLWNTFALGVSVTVFKLQTTRPCEFASVMAVSSYIPHLIYSVALTSFSFHLLFHRKQVDQDRAHIAAQTTILTSLATQLRSGPVPEAEVERLLRLAKTHEFQDSVITKEKEKAKIGWSDVFLGRENDPESESAQERETKALKARELHRVFIFEPCNL